MQVSESWDVHHVSTDNPLFRTHLSESTLCEVHSCDVLLVRQGEVWSMPCVLLYCAGFSVFLPPKLQHASVRWACSVRWWSTTVQCQLLYLYVRVTLVIKGRVVKAVHNNKKERTRGHTHAAKTHKSTWYNHILLFIYRKNTTMYVASCVIAV